jgi:hypothetical protein
MTDTYPNLRDFLGTLFYQGWSRTTDQGPDAYVEEFLRRAPPESLRAIAAELDDVLARDMSPQEFDDFLLDELGCYYAPTGPDGRRVWLRGLVQTIRLQRARSTRATSWSVL